MDVETVHFPNQREKCKSPLTQERVNGLFKE